MLVEYKHKKNTYNLGPRLLNSQDNIYTVIVGKNGTGKSRLLKSIIEDFIGSSNRYGEFSRERDLFSSHENKLGFHHRPQNIIAVSTSPFDKFPLMRNRNSVKGYSYLGLRNLRAPDLGKAYMSSVFTSLVYATQGNITAGRKISEVLNYLGYEGELEGRYHLELRSTLMDNVLESHDPIQAFIETHFKKNDFIAHRIN